MKFIYCALLFIVIIQSCKGQQTRPINSCATPSDRIEEVVFTGNKSIKFRFGVWQSKSDTNKYSYISYAEKSILNFDTILGQMQLHLFDNSLNSFFKSKNIYAITMYVEPIDKLKKNITLSNVKAISIYYVNNKMLTHTILINNNGFVEDKRFTKPVSALNSYHSLQLSKINSYYGSNNIDYITIGITEEKAFMKGIVKLDLLSNTLNKLTL